MNIRNAPSLLLSLIAGSAATPASAQVILDFNAAAAAAISPVPFSPWMTALIGAVLGVVGLVFLRRKTGQAAFLLMLSVFAGGAALIQTKDGYAYSIPALFSLITSGVVIPGTTVAWMTPGPVCGPIGYVRVTSGAGNITLSGIGYDAGYSALDPMNPPAPTDVPLPDPGVAACSVGTALDSSKSCIVWYKNAGGC